MKEKPVDGMQTGGKAAENGWHILEVGEGMDYIKNKEGVVFQDDKGNKAWRIPVTVNDENDPSHKAYVDCSIFESNQSDFFASVLLAVGLWKAIEEKFPGDDVSVFDSRIMDKVKTKIPGMTFMGRSEQDKEGRPKLRQVASFAKYKEILAEEKAKGKGKDKGKEESKGKDAAATATGDDW